MHDLVSDDDDTQHRHFFWLYSNDLRAFERYGSRHDIQRWIARHKH